MTMTDDRNTLSMEEQARRSRDDLAKDVERLKRLEALGSRAEDAADELREDLQNRNYGAGITYTIDVTLYGGGPAGGIEFEVEKGRYGSFELLRARQWHQDWFQPKGWVPVDDDVAEYLFALWGLEYMGEE